jgi:peptidoglycan/LPS O-acetylase OafA/YrhL
MPHSPIPANIPAKPSYCKTTIAFAVLAAPLAALLLIATLLLSGGLYFDIHDTKHWQWYAGMLMLLWLYNLPVALLCVLVMARLRLRRNRKGVLLTALCGLLITLAACVAGELILGDGHMDPLIMPVALLGGLVALLLSPFLPKADAFRQPE